MTANINPTFQDITPSTKGIPTMANWYLGNVITGVTEDALPWLLAQGWEVTDSYTSLLTGEQLYIMRRITIQNWNVLQELLTDFTNAYNEGRSANDKRYEDVVRLWTEMLDKSQTHLSDAKTSLTNEITLHMTKLDELESEFDEYFDSIKDSLDDLTLTLEADRTRVNNQFDALLSQSDQQLTDRGFYSSGMISVIDAGIEERRALALTEISEREQRFTADIAVKKSEAYLSVLRMRQGLVDAQLGLEGREQQFLAYQLDTRNKILMGLFGFVERRTDSYPDLGSLAQLTASLAETGAATWQST